MFDSIESIILSTAEAIRPPERLTVTEAAEKYRFINNPGSYVGQFDRRTTPYMIEPTDTLASTEHTGLIFVGSAQLGKTDTFLNWLIYSAMCDPSDMMLIEKSQVAARDFSIRRIARLSRHNALYASSILAGKQAQNTFDVRFKSGMLLTLSYPSINELSGKPVPRLWLSDYDRMPEDVDGEGNPFDLARKRATTFRRWGMCAAESTPGYDVENPRWLPTPGQPHEAPPTRGILALYNRGDRRRWMWRCVSCLEAFEPSFKLLHWPDSEDRRESAEACYLACPHCGQVYHHDGDEAAGIPGKRGLNLAGRWLREGERWNADGTITGRARRSDIASFWVKGPAATFTDWQSLVFKYLNAKDELEKTGSEQALKVVTNTDLGEPYLPQAAATALLPEELMSRRRSLGERTVPEGVRYLVTTVDVQRRSFECLTTGFDATGDAYVVDRWAIKKSQRYDEDGDVFPVAPASHKEDWHLLLEEVIRRTYPLADGSGRHMQVRAVGIDSGGREGVTTNAIEFWRWLRDQGEHRRVYLLKGVPNRDLPRVEVSYPDVKRKDRHSGARGDVPMLLIASNTVKDTLANRLLRKEPGGGMFSFPEWLPDSFYAEMTAESKVNGKWENPRRLRNESWDLSYYAIALTLSPLIQVEQIDWTSPPTWAASWDENSLVSEGGLRFESQPKTEYDLRKLGERFA